MTINLEEMAEKVAEKALDEFTYNGKTIREWVEIIVAEDFAIEKLAKIKEKISAKVDEFCDDEDADENIIVGLQIALDLIEDCEKESI